MKMVLIFFFQEEVGIRVGQVNGVQTCALPISGGGELPPCLGAPVPFSPRQGGSSPPPAPGTDRPPRRSRKGRSEERRVGEERSIKQVCKSRWMRHVNMIKGDRNDSAEERRVGR